MKRVFICKVMMNFSAQELVRLICNSVQLLW